MSISTAVEIANILNGKISSKDADENLLIASVKTPRGKLISEALGHDPAIVKKQAYDRAIELKYKQEFVKVCVCPVYTIELDWKVIPWVKPLGVTGDWLFLNDWVQIAKENELDLDLHVIKSETEYGHDRVSLKLWNLRSKCT